MPVSIGLCPCGYWRTKRHDCSFLAHCEEVYASISYFVVDVILANPVSGGKRSGIKIIRRNSTNDTVRRHYQNRAKFCILDTMWYGKGLREQCAKIDTSRESDRNLEDVK
jgi:hypothetical protein